MDLSALDLCLWAVGLIAHLGLVIVLWFRHRVRKFRFFFALISASVLRTIALYEVLHHGSWQTYNSCYWAMAILDTVLQLLVIYVLAMHVFRPLGTWAPDIRRSAYTLMLFSVFVGAGLTWLAAPRTATWKDTFVIKGSFLFSCVVCELLVCMIVLSATAGLPWKTHAARIAQGLGVYSLIDVLIEAAHSYYGQAYSTHIDTVLNHVRMSVYLMVVAYWAVTLWIEEPRPRELPVEVRRQLLLLYEWAPSGGRTLRDWRK